LPVVLDGVKPVSAGVDAGQGSHPNYPSEWLMLMERCDALRKPGRFLDLIKAASCVQAFRSLDAPTDASVIDVATWERRVAAIRSIDAGAIAQRHPGQPQAIKQALRQARLEVLEGFQAAGT